MPRRNRPVTRRRRVVQEPVVVIRRSTEALARDLVVRGLASVDILENRPRFLTKEASRDRS